MMPVQRACHRRLPPLTPGERMPYTVWSRGRLIGQSTLGYKRAAPGLLAGDFEPSPLGEKLMPIITGVGPALKNLHRVADDVVRIAEGQADGNPAEAFPDDVRRTTEYADAMSLVDELDSLALELRDPDGAVVATESIAVNDTEYLLARAREPDPLDDIELSPELEEAIARDVEEMLAREREVRANWDFEDDEEEAWRPEPIFARYQLLVVLEGGPLGRGRRRRHNDEADADH